MPWARFDDQIYDHPKIEALSDKAVLVHSHALTKAGLTRGLISFASARSLLRRWEAPESVIAELTAVAPGCTSPLWHKAPGGYRIHDWKDFAPPAAEHQKTAGKARAAASKRDQTGRFAAATTDTPSENSGWMPAGYSAGPAGSSRAPAGWTTGNDTDATTSTSRLELTHPAGSSLPDSDSDSDSDHEKGIMRAPKTAPASASRGSPDPEPDPEWQAEVDRLRTALRLRDRRKAQDVDNGELRLALTRRGEYAGIPREAIRPAIARGLRHLLAALEGPEGVERWGRYFRTVVLAEGQNGAAEAVQEQAEQHREDLDAATIAIFGTNGRRPI